MPSSFQAGTSEYIGHRNYNNLSSRSPDDIIEEVDLHLLHHHRNTQVPNKTE